MKKILVIGQTPPPYYGQSMMIERLVKADFTDIQIYHVRMVFSKSPRSVGRFGINKIFHLWYIIFKSILMKYRHNIQILYYFPAGPNFIPIIRDVILLSCIRPFFKKTVFHFRAAGISEYLENAPKLLKWMAMRAYNTPNVSIQLSLNNPKDGAYFNTKKLSIIKNGLEDDAKPYLPIQRDNQGKPINILYVGMLHETKGILVLLEAARQLLSDGNNITVTLVGGFTSLAFEKKVYNFCHKYQISDQVLFAGEKKGQDKWRYFLDADIFCFPSFYESESFGNVLVEAMMFELPIVSTYWRGIPDIVENGKNGWLVSIKDSEALAKKLRYLVDDYQLRTKMGKCGRLKYENSYSLSQHLESMRAVFLEV